MRKTPKLGNFFSYQTNSNRNILVIKICFSWNRRWPELFKISHFFKLQALWKYLVHWNVLKPSHLSTNCNLKLYAAMCGQWTLRSNELLSVFSASCRTCRRTCSSPWRTLQHTWTGWGLPWSPTLLSMMPKLPTPAYHACIVLYTDRSFTGG